MTETFDAKTAMAEYRLAFEAGCDDFLKRYPDTELYAPVRYLMALGGKRLRPVLVMAASEACGGTKAQALPAGGPRLVWVCLCSAAGMPRGGLLCLRRRLLKPLARLLRSQRTRLQGRQRSERAYD